MEAYEKLLDKALENLPEEALRTARFEIPKVRGHLQGQRTVLSNIHQIASFLHRDTDHFVKFLLRELATPGNLKAKGLILGRKISASQVNEKVQQYTRTFVLCKECGKPDTKLTRDNRVSFIKCMACGAKHPVSGKI